MDLVSGCLLASMFGLSFFVYYVFVKWATPRTYDDQIKCSVNAVTSAGARASNGQKRHTAVKAAKPATNIVRKRTNKLVTNKQLSANSNNAKVDVVASTSDNLKTSENKLSSLSEEPNATASKTGTVSAKLSKNAEISTKILKTNSTLQTVVSGVKAHDVTRRVVSEAVHADTKLASVKVPEVSSENSSSDDNQVINGSVTTPTPTVTTPTTAVTVNASGSADKIVAALSHTNGGDSKQPTIAVQKKGAKYASKQKLPRDAVSVVSAADNRSDVVPPTIAANQIVNGSEQQQIVAAAEDAQVRTLLSAVDIASLSESALQELIDLLLDKQGWRYSTAVPACSRARSVTDMSRRVADLTEQLSTEREERAVCQALAVKLREELTEQKRLGVRQRHLADAAVHKVQQEVALYEQKLAALAKSGETQLAQKSDELLKLRAECDKLVAERDISHSQATHEQQAEIERVNECLQQRSAELAATKSREGALAQQLDEAQTARARHEEQAKQTQCELEEAQRRVCQLEKRCQDILAANTRLNDEATRLSDELAECQSHEQAGVEEAARLEARCHTLAAELCASQSEAKSLSAQLEEGAHSAESLQSRLAELETRALVTDEMRCSLSEHAECGGRLTQVREQAARDTALVKSKICAFEQQVSDNFCELCKHCAGFDYDVHNTYDYMALQNGCDVQLLEDDDRIESRISHLLARCALLHSFCSSVIGRLLSERQLIGAKLQEAELDSVKNDSALFDTCKIWASTFSHILSDVEKMDVKSADCLNNLFGHIHTHIVNASKLNMELKNTNSELSTEVEHHRNVLKETEEMLCRLQQTVCDDAKQWELRLEQKQSELDDVKRLLSEYI